MGALQPDQELVQGLRKETQLQTSPGQQIKICQSTTRVQYYYISIHKYIT